MGEQFRIYVDFGKLGVLSAQVDREELIILIKRGIESGENLTPIDILADIKELPKVLNFTEPTPKLTETRWLAGSACEAADLLRDVLRERGGNNYFIEEVEREEGRDEEGSKVRVSNYASRLGIPTDVITWPTIRND